MADLIDPDRALADMLAAAEPLGETQCLPLENALGRVLAEAITAPADVPGWDNSAVDGYALHTADALAGVELPVSQRIPAGHCPESLKRGTAARIFTGAPVPEGADAVVMQESTQTGPSCVRLLEPVEAGQNIRPRGQDVRAGDLALPARTVLRPPELGLIASLGIAEVRVRRALKVAIFTTGDELREPGQPLETGQLYNSNRFTLTSLLKRAGCEIERCATLPDQREATEQALTEAAQSADLIITSGGVSVGEEDHVRAVIEDAGRLHLWKLAIKPGKPLAFGHLGETPVIGLPGNPAAVLVTFLVMALPFIRVQQGLRPAAPRGQRLKAGCSITRSSHRREYLRSRIESDEAGTRVMIHPNQSSGMLSSACWGDGLAVLPEHTTLNEGDDILYFSYAELMEPPQWRQ